MSDLTPEQIKALNEEMAKTGTTADQVLGKIKNFTSAAASNLTGLTALVGKVSTGFSDFGDTLKNISNDMTGVSTKSEGAKIALLGLTGLAINARVAFEGLGGVDPGNINTFSGQLRQLEESLSGTPLAASLAKNSITSMLDGMKDKIAPDIFKNLKSSSHGVVLKFITDMAQKADNMTRLQASLIAVSAATGNLSNIYEKAGAGLNNINAVLVRHEDAMHATVAATGAAPKEVEKYYMALGHVPGALESIVSSGTAAGGNMNMLTAVMKMAAGNGRAVEAVTKDMGDAWKSFAMKGEVALTFVNRFSELANNLGVEFDDMKAALSGAAGAFKDIGDAGKHQEGIVDGLTNMMNKYIFSLKEAGMTGKHAADVAAGVADGFTKMTVGQRAFLSAQTGGPGGLLGGLQIQKMLRDNDIPGMQKKMMEAMQKQLGPIITMDEALKGGQAGAAKFERQTQMMMKGPLASGMGIKTEMDAAKMLEAMKAMQEGKAPKELGKGPDTLQAAINKGTDIEKQTYSEVTKTNVRLDALNRSTDFIAGGFAATNFGIARGANADLSKLQKARAEQMSAAGKEGGVGAEKLGVDMKSNGAMTDTSAESRGKAIVGVVNWVKDLGGMLSGALSPLTSALSKGDNKEINKTNADLTKEINALRTAKGATVGQKAYADELSAARDKAMKAYVAIPAATTAAAAPPPVALPTAKKGEKPTTLNDAMAAAVARDRGEPTMPVGEKEKIAATLTPAGAPATKELTLPERAPLPSGKSMEELAKDAAARGTAKKPEVPGAPGSHTVTKNVEDAGGNNIDITVKVTPKGGSDQHRNITANRQSP